MAEYIEREKAYEAVLFATCGSGYQYEATCAIDLMPAADVAPVVHGQWIDVGERYDDYDECFYSVFKCSNCGTTKEEYPTSNYCPNCGAKMDEE